MGILSKVWVPGFVGGIAAAGGWLSGSLANNMNDALLWGRIFLDQAHTDVEKAAANAAKGKFISGSGGQVENQPKTIIRMTEEKKPQQFIGTLFSAKLENVEQFERAVDDEIVDMADLTADIKINLNRWLKSLPGRMGYSVVIRKDPVDEYGTLQSGIWATLTLFITHISGKTTPIDTILLGPVSPQVRLEIVKSVKTIEQHIPGMMTGQEVREITVPNGTVDIFGVDGERVSPSTVQPTATPATTAPAVDTSRQPGETEAQQKKRLEGVVSDLQKQLADASKQTNNDNSSPVGNKYKVTTGGTNLNRRIADNLSSPVLATYRDGAVVTVQDVGKTDGGYTWWHVNGPGGSGWVASEFLTKV